MDILTFATKIIEGGVWPVSALIIVIFLRKELQAIMPLITKFKAGPIEVEFEQIKKELKSIKTLAESAEAKADVVATKFDEGDVNPETEVFVKSDRKTCGSPVSDLEKQVLKAMCDSRFATRSISGVAKDTGLTKATVQTVYGGLIGKGLLDQTQNKEGQQRWFVTALGRAIASES